MNKRNLQIYNKKKSDTEIIKYIKNEIYNNVKKAFIKIKEVDLLGDLDANIITLYQKIKKLYNTKKLLQYYFGTVKNTSNGYLQKNDVYALGLTIFEILHIYSDYKIREHPKLYDLLKNMLLFYPDQRYNVVQCINHPYLSK